MRYFKVKAEEWDDDSHSYYDRALLLEVDEEKDKLVSISVESES